MTDNEVIEAINEATCGTFIGKGYTSTLMGWIDKYDEKGRILTADPNYKDSEVIIAGTKYRLTRKGWYACVWNPKYEQACYTWMWLDNWEKYTIGGEIDLRPDYVKEYQERQSMDNKGREV